MTLTTMRTSVRRDLKDEDSGNYRWTDNEVNRAIARAVAEFSLYVPREMKSTFATVAAAKTLDISTLTSRISVDRVEFPVDQQPRTYTRFELYLDLIYFLETTGDGTNCYVYWSTVHTLDTSSTIPTRYDDLVALGAAAYAALSQSQYSTERASYGGADADMDYRKWGEQRLAEFKDGLKQANRKIKFANLINDE